MEFKYKVGDTVIIKSGENISGYAGGWSSCMNQYVGHVVTIRMCLPDFSYPSYKVSGNGYTFDERGLEFVSSRVPAATVPEIKNVVFNKPLTIIIWADGTKTFVKCGEGDTYDPEKGMAMAITKKAYGNRYRSTDIIDEWVERRRKK